MIEVWSRTLSTLLSTQGKTKKWANNHETRERL